MSDGLFSAANAMGLEVSTDPVLSLISALFAIGIVLFLSFWGMGR